ncbi:threonine/serine exporter family protein [uncultured Phascolarctobacterium sp.]|uniref:threonine/serine exporter family protein n=1 Tax=uncultured Phascolarctobacterium sp. TaxID=512296 RepID=UPI0025E44E33|nr:threonine/serine exporter family protein [uncultured Phascolarctobacterium sp.]
MDKAAVCLTREQTLNVALNMGKVLLRSGAETSRVEDTIVRFCHINGYHDVNVFVTPTVILIGDENSGSSTIMCRIRSRSTNLSNVSAINEFSYNVQRWHLSYEDSMAYLDKLLNSAPPYGKWAICLASAVCSATFASMLGGNSHDFIAAFVTGGLSMVLLKQLGGYRPSAFWENTLAGAAIGFLAILCCAVSVQCTRTNIIVGALMPFLPGVAFTNGLRDYMAGDLISGNSRIAEALLFATSIAIGLAFSLLVWYHWGWDLWPKD